MDTDYVVREIEGSVVTVSKDPEESEILEVPQDSVDISDQPVEETPVEETPVEVPVEETPVEVPVEETPVEVPVEVPVEETPVEVPVEVPVEETPVEETPAEVPADAVENIILSDSSEKESDKAYEKSSDKAVAEIPTYIFIVPYRDREEQLRFFDFQMKQVLENLSYKIIYSHQKDQRSFNRGAMKNIGFLYAKSLYPNDYQNITFVFNDVDTMPYTKGFLNYDTKPGFVKHFYGYKFTLGGIVSIKGADFEKANGFPNYWAWGYEDNAFQGRVLQSGLQIDRDQFYPIMDKNILQLKDGMTRVVNRGEFDRYVDEFKYKTRLDGLKTISSLAYTYDESSAFLNVTNFNTMVEQNTKLDKVHDMRDGFIPFKQTPRRGNPLMKMAYKLS